MTNDPIVEVKINTATEAGAKSISTTGVWQFICSLAAKFLNSALLCIVICWCWKSWAYYTFMEDGKKALSECRYDNACLNFTSAAQCVPFILDWRKPTAVAVKDITDIKSLQKSLFETFTNDEPKYVRALIDKGVSEKLQGLFDDASATFQQAELEAKNLDERDPMTYEIRLERIDLQKRMHLEYRPVALLLYQNLLNDLPTAKSSLPATLFQITDLKAKTYQAIGELEWSSKDIPAAAVAFQRSHELFSSLISFKKSFAPEMISLLVDEGALYSGQGRYDDCKACYKQIDKIIADNDVSPHNADRIRYMVSKADFLMQQKDYDGVPSLLSEAVANGKEITMKLQAMTRLLRCYVSTKKQQQAQDIINQIEPLLTEATLKIMDPLSLAHLYTVEGFYYFALQSDVNKAKDFLNKAQKISGASQLTSTKKLAELTATHGQSTEVQSAQIPPDQNPTSAPISNGWWSRFLPTPGVNASNDSQYSIDKSIAYIHNSSNTVIQVTQDNNPKSTTIQPEETGTFGNLKRGDAPIFHLSTIDHVIRDLSPGSLAKVSYFFEWNGQEFTQHYP